MLRSQPALIKFCLCALFSTCAAGTACAASAADELADCLYANTSAQDKTTFLQWAYVALGRTEAAKSVQTIPAAKIKTVEKKSSDNTHAARHEKLPQAGDESAPL